MKPKSALLAAFAGYLYYRSHDIWMFAISPPLPQQYFAYGNASTACRVIHDPTVRNPASSRFRYCEDVVSWDVPGDQPQHTKHLLLSCDPGRKSWNTVMGPLNDPTPRGDLWIYSYSKMPSAGIPRRLVLDGFPEGASFHPLGIDVIANPAGKDYRLFVVNHGKDNSTIEIFSLPDPSLLAMSVTPKAYHLRTLTHRKFVSPNAVHALSPTSFYVTNDHTSTRRIQPPMLGAALAVAETFFRYHTGWVDLVRFSEESGGPQNSADGVVTIVKKAALRIPFANGIAASPDGRTVAVVSSNDLQVLLYDRDPATDKLSYATNVPIPFYPDNVSFDANGSIVLAGHPSFKSLIKVAHDSAESVTGSWVVEITKVKGQYVWRGENASSTAGPYTDIDAPFPTHVRAPIVRSHLLKTLYQGDGTGYSTSSSAVLDRDFGKLFTVGLYGHGMLQCNMESVYGGPRL